MNRYIVHFWHTSRVCIVKASTEQEALHHATGTGMRPREITLTHTPVAPAKEAP